MEKDRLIFTIERYDHYYDSVNNKGNIVLGFSTVIFGALLTIYPALNDKVEFNSLMYVMLIGACLFGFLAMITLLITSIPYSRSKIKSSTNSLLFYQSVADRSKSEFLKSTEEYTEDDEINDLRNQTYDLAKGLSQKFKNLKRAIYFIIVQMIILVPLIILILTHIKP